MNKTVRQLGHVVVSGLLLGSGYAHAAINDEAAFAEAPTTFQAPNAIDEAISALETDPAFKEVKGYSFYDTHQWTGWSEENCYAPSTCSDVVYLVTTSATGPGKYSAGGSVAAIVELSRPRHFAKVQLAEFLYDEDAAEQKLDSAARNGKTDAEILMEMYEKSPNATAKLNGLKLPVVKSREIVKAYNIVSAGGSGGEGYWILETRTNKAKTKEVTVISRATATHMYGRGNSITIFYGVELGHLGPID